MPFTLNKRYNCPFCKRVFVVLQGYSIYSVLPVDVITGKEVFDSVFDKDKHVSHLLSCPELQGLWEGKKEEYRKYIRAKQKKNDKQMMK